MKSVACLCLSVRAACPQTSACLPPGRALDTGSKLSFHSRTAVARQPARSLHVNTAAVPQVSAAPLPTPAHIAGQREEDRAVFQCGRRVPPPASLRSPCGPDAGPQSPSAVRIRPRFEGGVVSEPCARLADLPSDDRAGGLATALGACAELGLDAGSPLVRRLVADSLQLLSGRVVGVTQLRLLAEAACALEGRRSALVAEALRCVGVAVEEDTLSPGEAAGVYSLLALCHDPASQQEALMLPTLHMRTQRLVPWLKAHEVCRILQDLLKLQPRPPVSLVLRLSHRASRVFKAFSDDEVMKVLSALMVLGQHDEELLGAMEKHLPERLGTCDPELTSTVMEFCLLMKCRSEPIFEAVAENFVRRAETHSTLQIAKQIVAMGRLNYLPQCSSQLFKKLESILSTRFSQFQPRSLIEVLHACIHLERFPLNYMTRVFSQCFLQRLQAHGEPLDRNALGQLTQIHLSSSLECHYYMGPRLPYFPYVKKFSSVDQAFETPMDALLYKRVKGPLARLLGGEFYSTRIFTHTGYTIDVEICLDEQGYVLPLPQWDQTYKRLALCLDGQNRFCSNTQHLLGKEATKRRHLRRMGFEVIQIPYFEFERLRTEKEKVQYLHNKIFPTIFKFHHKASSIAT